MNQAIKAETVEGAFFIKLNDAKAYPGMFEAEIKGLKLLGDHGTAPVPEALLTGSAGDISYLVLRWIEEERKAPGFWEDFGAGLGRLHRNTGTFFGLDHNNYIGLLPQSNANHSTWTDFFIQQRLEPQIRDVYNARKCDSSLVRRFENLYRKLDELFPPEPPALLHGDLWSGNFMAGPQGVVYLIDPAVYYGHREMDIAMTRLFGGFEKSFYEGYHEENPLEKGFESRTDICNLYPLLVHVNLFGGSYQNQVEEIIKKF